MRRVDPVALEMFAVGGDPPRGLTGRPQRPGGRTTSTIASSMTPGRHWREVAVDAAGTSVTVIIGRLLFAARRSVGAACANVRIGPLRWDCGTLPRGSSERTVARDQAGGNV